MSSSKNFANNANELNWIGRNKLLYTFGDLSITFFIDADNEKLDVYVDTSDIVTNNKKAKKYFEENRAIIIQNVMNWIKSQGCNPKVVDADTVQAEKSLIPERESKGK